MNFKTTTTKLILGSSFLFTLFFNYRFFSNVLDVYPLNHSSFLFLLSVFIILMAVINIVLNLLAVVRLTVKPVLIGLILLSAIAAFVMDSYHTVIDDVMLLNIFHTDSKETLDLLSFKLLGYLLLLGVIPSWLIFKVKLKGLSFKQEFTGKGKSILLSVVIVFILLLSFGKNYASFFREHKTLRYYTNPTYYIYSVGKYIHHYFDLEKRPLTPIGLDATIFRSSTKRRIFFLVVGETARRDHFSLNGYPLETNPLLKKEKVVSFNNMTSCGTSTAISVPCLFSHLSRSDFSAKKAANTENLLDVLMRTKKVNILWRDNNSDSKGVALRVSYEDYKSPKNNTICDVECRDEGMLVGLKEYIQQKKEGDIFIIFHQMGNHGPAYYKRYPHSFEKFKPTCKTNALEKCTNQEIINAYDNAILYTDYFLSKSINFLKPYSDDFDTAMFYVSDHGESLGEKGIYLHGLPYLMAPDEQKNIAAILWLGGKLKQKIADQPFSHDNIFHTILGFFEVQTTLYNKNLDILAF